MIKRIDTAAAESGRRFDSMFETHHRDVVRYCVRRLGAADGEDAAAEVFAVAWRRMDAVPMGDSTKAWLLSVAYRIVANQYRARARRGRLVARLSSLRESGLREPEVLDLDHEKEAILAALNSLRSADRELLMMVAWDRLSRSDIASVLGIAENAVDQRLFRARARFRNRLGASHSTQIETMGA